MGVSPGEVERRYANVRAALEHDGLDAALVCGSEYTGFEGAVTYLSGFQIVHRYAYVAAAGARASRRSSSRREARYVGEHGTSWIDEQVFAERPGDWLAERLRGSRVGVYGLDYVMARARLRRARRGVRARPLGRPRFDLARAVKSDEELESVRESVRINTTASTPSSPRTRPGETAAEVMAPAEELFVGARVRAADDEHGPGGRRVRDRAGGDGARRALHPLARDRRARAATGSRSRARSGSPTTRCCG